MDILISRKERRLQPGGVAEVLVNNIFDLYPIYADDGRIMGNPETAGYFASMSDAERANLIVDIEIIDDPRAELLDRAMFALVKQRGMDPLDADDGIQWAEYLLGEVPAPVILLQASNAVAEEGPGVKMTSETVQNAGKSYTVFNIGLTNAT
jgi:hypothetical protein